jgi:MurNAc alpha-1-phosphate uridylyltransferase
MRAMILAAGRGERMGALTEAVPKPLLKVKEKYLIEYALQSVVAAGITEIVINICHHGEQIKAALGTGERYGATLVYSEEQTRLETGGGIFQALPLLGEHPFLVVSSDVITDYPLHRFALLPKSLAHLVMVRNPIYHPEGDFALQEGKLYRHRQPTLTFASIGLYHPQLFAHCKPGHFRLFPHVIFPAIDAGCVSGELYQGAWLNVGTPADLQEANQAPQ